MLPSIVSRRSEDDVKHVGMVYDNAAVEHQLSADRNEMLAPDFSRVLVIYTGGTIGMKHTREHGYIPLPNYLAQCLAKIQRFHDPNSSPSLSRNPSNDSLYQLNNGSLPPKEDSAFSKITNTVRTVRNGQTSIFQLPSLITPVSLYGKKIRYSILEYEPLLDSCNMTMDDWVRIAGDIEANYELFDAFIVLHGTDTMAYTASALSFMLEELGKTVIITGSQVPLTEVRNDAVENLLGALTIAGHFVIPEVCLYFGKKLYRGNRTSKISAVDFDAFDSPNLPALVELGIDIDVHWPLVLRPTRIAKFRAHKVLDRNVASLRLFPGINETTVRSFLAPPIRGVVLETYGAGNAPARADLLAALKEASDRGVVIVNCTQCRKGLVTDSYATGRQLAAVGVVAGADMTPECALTKLSYLLGKIPDNPQQVRNLMTRNLRGELTVRHPQQRFSASSNRTHVLIHAVMNLTRASTNSGSSSHQQDKTKQEEEAMPVEEQLLAEKALAPILMCSAAATNDLEAMQLLYDTMGELVNLNCVDYEGRSPLHVACGEGHMPIVEFLLRHGASIHVRDKEGHTPLFVAIVKKRAEAVAMLRAAGAHIAESEREDLGPVWLKAVRDGNIKLVQIALDAGWPVNWRDSVAGYSALDVAASEGRLSVLKLLLAQKDLDIHARDRWGYSAMEKLERMEDDENVRGRVSIELVKEMRRLIQARQ